MKACVLDIETSDLAAIGPGFVLCAVVRDTETKKSYTFRYDELHCQLAHEMKLINSLMDCLGDYSLWIGHNIEAFDWPYLKSRAAAIDKPLTIPPVVTYDTLKAFRRCKFRTVNNFAGKPTCRLDHIVDFFGLTQEKTPLYPREHWVTVWGTGEDRLYAMNKLVDHCVKDVRMTELVMERIWVSDPYPHFQPLR